MSATQIAAQDLAVAIARFRLAERAAEAATARLDDAPVRAARGSAPRRFRVASAAVLALLAVLVGAPAFAGELASRSVGACYVDTTNATTGEEHAPVFACVPAVAPDGVEVGTVWEDGSAEYPGSGFYFDPALSGFAPAQRG